MPITRSKPRVFREQIFGFLLTEEFARQRPEFKKIMDKRREVPSEQERKRLESRLCSSIVGVMVLRIQPFWPRATLEHKRSGLVIALSNNRSPDALTTPSPEVIERMQKEMELDVTVQPRWMNAF